MSAPLAGAGGEPTGATARAAGWIPAGAVVLAALVLGHLVAAWAAPVLGSRMLPWILGRGLGLAGYLCLVALVVSGMWFRHPWRGPSRLVGSAARLRLHACLAAATGVLVAGHVVSLALDSYAGVGWAGTLVPGRSGYRPLPVALGTAALYAGLLVGGTAALAGRLAVRARWRAVHLLALPAFGAVWVHGVLAGSDAATLRPVYIGTGVLVVTMAVTRWYAGRAELRLENAR